MNSRSLNRSWSIQSPKSSFLTNVFFFKLLALGIHKKKRSYWQRTVEKNNKSDFRLFLLTQKDTFSGLKKFNGKYHWDGGMTKNKFLILLVIWIILKIKCKEITSLKWLMDKALCKAVSAKLRMSLHTRLSLVCKSTPMDKGIIEDVLKFPWTYIVAV